MGPARAPLGRGGRATHPALALAKTPGDGRATVAPAPSVVPGAVLWLEPAAEVRNTGSRTAADRQGWVAGATGAVHTSGRASLAMATGRAPRPRPPRPAPAVVTSIPGRGLARAGTSVAQLAVRDISVGRRLPAGRRHPMGKRAGRVVASNRIRRVARRVRGLQTRARVAPSARGSSGSEPAAKVPARAVTDTRP